jgi:hypothetical protein
MPFHCFSMVLLKKLKDKNMNHIQKGLNEIYRNRIQTTVEAHIANMHETATKP